MQKLPPRSLQDGALILSGVCARDTQIAIAAGEQVTPGTRDPAKLSIRNFSSCSTKIEAWGGNLRRVNCLTKSTSDKCADSFAKTFVTYLDYAVH